MKPWLQRLVAASLGIAVSTSLLQIGHVLLSIAVAVPDPVTSRTIAEDIRRRLNFVNVPFGRAGGGRGAAGFAAPPTII